MLDFELYDEFFAHPLDFRWHPHVEQLPARDNLTFAVFEEQPPASNVYAATDFAAAYANISVLHILQASTQQMPCCARLNKITRECHTCRQASVPHEQQVAPHLPLCEHLLGA